MIRQMWASVRPVSVGQWFLWWCGTVLLASAAVHGVVELVDGGSWLGSVSWRKPILFGESFGLLMWSSVWVLRQLPRRWWGGPLTALLGLSSVIEVTLITMQRWRGVASHFNESTTFDEGVFSFMGMTVLLAGVSVTVLLIWAVFDFRGSAIARIAALVGLTSLVVAGYIGTDMISVGKDVYTATGHVPENLVFGVAGSAKVAHAAGIHALQVLGVLAVLLEGAAMANRVKLQLMILAAIGYSATFAAITVSAYEGRSWVEPTLPMGALGLIGAVLVGIVYLRALPREHAVV